MPHRITPFFSGGYYHIFNRGNNRPPIFFERENYFYFLRQLRKYLVLDKVEIVAYCLMPNHFHLLVCLKSDNFATLVRPFALSYAKAINKRFERTGSLFEGPFKSILVEKNEYLLHLSCYIHANPIAAGMVKHAEEWEFSSYRDYLSLREDDLVNTEIVMHQFDVPTYRQFVEEYQPSDSKKISHLLFD
jgi:REP element-mobilizing transposase RayT